MVAAVGIPWLVFAHGTDRARGQQLAQDLQAGTVQCATLDETKFENMGDYYMEQMMGESHVDMDAMMERTMGEEGLSQMHTAMGRRMSGCDTSAQMPAGMTSGMGGMMNMMGGSGVRGLYPTGVATIWYVIGILSIGALALVIVKYLRELINKK